MTLSLEQLVAIMPHCHSPAANLPFLVRAMQESGITTPARAAAFLAQLAHESVELGAFEEYPHRHVIPHCKVCETKGPHEAGAQYEGRHDLGNYEPGDGVRYKGRGPIQLTGRKNYALASVALQEDLVGHPEKAADPDVGFRVAAWYWRIHGLNELADLGDFDLITRRINGGLNGKAQRDEYYARAKHQLGVA